MKIAAHIRDIIGINTVPSELFIKVTIVEKDPVFRKNKNRTACSGHQIMTFQI